MKESILRHVYAYQPLLEWICNEYEEQVKYTTICAKSVSINTVKLCLAVNDF